MAANVVPTLGIRRRGRPALTGPPDVIIEHKRALNRNRVRAWRFHRPAQDSDPTDAQRSQRDHVLTAAVEQLSPSPTPLKLGLRLSNLQLAEDPTQEHAADEACHDVESKVVRSASIDSLELEASDPPTPADSVFVGQQEHQHPFPSSPGSPDDESSPNEAFYDASLIPRTSISSSAGERSLDRLSSSSIASDFNPDPIEARSPVRSPFTQGTKHSGRDSSPLPPSSSRYDLTPGLKRRGSGSQQPDDSRYPQPGKKQKALQRQRPDPQCRKVLDDSEDDEHHYLLQRDSRRSESPASPAPPVFIDAEDEEPLLYYQPSPGPSSVPTVREDIDGGAYLPPSTSSPILMEETDPSELDELPSRIPSPDRLDPAPTTLDDYREATVQRIIDQLLHFPGCLDTSHQERHTEHVRSHVGDHVGVAATWQHDLRNTDILGTNCFIKDSRVPHGLPPPDSWRRIFHGKPSKSAAPPTICLHVDEPPPSPVDVRFDFDSFLGFASSLAFAQGGIRFTPYPSLVRNVTQDLHMTNQRPVDTGDPDQLPPAFDVRNTAHYHFGYVENTACLSIYILFPHLQEVGEKFHGLSDQQLEAWTDRAVIPAIKTVCESHVTQKIPGSLRGAKLNASAPHVETRHVDGQGYRAQAAISHFLPPTDLGPIWEEINRRVADDDSLHLFRGCQIFFTAKGIKVEHTMLTGGLLQCIDAFDEWITNLLDLEYIFEDYFYVDIGKEIKCPYHRSCAEDVRDGQEPQAFFFRTCCAQAYLDHLYQGPDRGRHTFYTPALLGGITNLTSIPGKGSTLARGGLLYVQLYGSWINVFNAIKTYPFANTGLEELGLDPEVRKAAASAARSATSNIHVLERAYLACKARVDRAIQDAQVESWSARQEIRIVWRTKDLLQSRLSASSRATRSPTTLLQPPNYICRLPTQKFCEYLWHSANKFASVFEYIQSAYRHGRIPWDATGLMVMALRLLEHCVSASDLSREGALYWDRRENPATGNHWQGLGFRASLQEYNYCWPKEVVYWPELRWKTQYQSSMLFGNRALRQRYARYSQGLIASFEDDLRHVEQMGRWLRLTPDPEKQRTMMIHIAHVVLRRLRCDLLGRETVTSAQPATKIRTNALPQQQDFFLCHDSLVKIYGKALSLSAGNHTKFRDPLTMVKYLFGRKDDMDQKGWRLHCASKPYRVLFFTATDEIERGYSGSNARLHWEGLFYRELVEYHWLYPIPDTSKKAGTLSTRTERRQSDKWNGETQIRWWPIKRRKGPKQPGDLLGWAWGGTKVGQNVERGQPKPYPPHLGWSTTDWKSWLGVLSE